MTISSRPKPSSQRGAVLIHVAIALLGLIGFATFVVDYGIMWASRGQAQNAADAGALSGAIALAFDNATDFAGAREKARSVAISNLVFGQAPDVDLAQGDVTFPTCPPNTPGGPGSTCVKVDVYRNVLRGNPLPMFFGHIVGVGDQGVRATATAQIIPGQLNECLKPWAVIDRWDEYSAAGGEPDWPNPDPDYNYYDSTFDKYSTGQGNAPPQEPDLYVPPSKQNDDAGTGFSLPNDYGRQYVVKMDTNTNSTVSPGWFRAIRIPRLDGQTGGSVYRDNITTCGGLPTGFAEPTTVCPTNITNANMAFWAEKGCYSTEPGNMVGPTRQGVEDIIALDSGASWSGGGIVGTSFPGHTSPRIVPIGVIDIDHFLSQDPSGANGVLRMNNIFGFFIEGFGEIQPNGSIQLQSNGKAIVGRLMTLPALQGSTILPNQSAFLTKVILVR